MIYLKIDNGKGLYLDADNSMQEIDTIQKEDIMRLLNLATDNSIVFEMDEITDSNIQNEAHRIIYGSIYKKFKELLDDRDRFVDESENLYKEAIEKYT